MGEGREYSYNLVSRLVRLINDACTASATLDGVEVIVSDDPISCWSAIEEACEEVIVDGVAKSSGVYLIHAKCVSLNASFVFEVSREFKPFMIHPILALFKDEEFIDEGLSNSFT
ncbi:MAG: hypothetical protein QW521_00990 [Desulfurococcaceae archaeon]